MDKTRKIKMIGAAVLIWLTIASCIMPDVVSGLSGAIGDIFQSIGDSIKF